MKLQDLVQNIVTELMTEEDKGQVVIKYQDEIAKLSERDKSLIEFYCYMCIENESLIADYMSGDDLAKVVVKKMLNAWAACKRVEIEKHKYFEDGNFVLVPIPFDLHEKCMNSVLNLKTEHEAIEQMKALLKEKFDIEDYLVDDHVKQFYEKVKENGGFKSYAKDYQRTKAAGQKMRDS